MPNRSAYCSYLKLGIGPCLLALLLVVPSFALAQERPAAIEFDRQKGIWNPAPLAPDNQRQIVKVLVLNYDPISPADKHQPLSRVFGWTNAAVLAAQYKEVMERASGGYLRFEIVEWRNLNEIYVQMDGHRYTIEEYVKNRRAGKGWHEKGGNADYPRIMREQNVPPLIDDGTIDEVWIFSDHFFGLWEASMAGPGAFFINGGVYPNVPTRRPFAFYGFNYERGAAEMAHNTSHRTECTLNRVYGQWNLKTPVTNWDKFSANHDQSDGLAGVGTCHWPANAKQDYDYGNKREVLSWADDFLTYPKLTGERKPVSSETWSAGGNDHLGYMRWYFAHLPRAIGVNEDGRQNNWWKYLYDFDNYTQNGKPKPASAELRADDVYFLDDADHVVRVVYRSPVSLDMATLGDDDLEAKDPAGKSLAIKFEGVSDSRPGTYRVAVYRIAAPDGKWKEAVRGAYKVALRPEAVKDALGNAVPAGELGMFSIGPDVALKRLRVEPPRPTVKVGDRAFLKAFVDGKSGEAREVTPLVRWSAAEPKFATIDRRGMLRGLAPGDTKLTVRLGTLEASISVMVEGIALPTARLVEARNITGPGRDPVKIVVEYADTQAIDADSLGLADLRVTGPHEFQQFPAFKGHKQNGQKVLATYEVAAPEKGWNTSTAGTYVIEIKGYQVHATAGRFVADGKLGAFELR